ncbi:MAG: hypothetical protein V1870_03170, partial [Candidatus Aenigmatarchaeota archaeon]
SCSNAQCTTGTTIDCNTNNLAAILTCANNPDNNPSTWDYFAGFTSSCNEASDSCTSSTISLIHTCSQSSCGAQCDENNTCTATECDNLDGCVGDNYYNYADKTNDCLGNCSCESNSCSSPTITQNDARCTECQIDNDCNSLDNDYCSGTPVKHDEGKCVNYACQVETSTTSNCSTQDNNFCNETQIKHDAYTCNNAQCIKDTTSLVQECNDNLYCNGQESCSNAQCTTGTTIDCNTNNLAAILTCANNPDNNPSTWDYFAGFTSSCNENTDSCTSSTISLTHNCSKTSCGAQCEINNDCDDNNQLTTDTCLANCSCYYIQKPDTDNDGISDNQDNIIGSVNNITSNTALSLFINGTENPNTFNGTSFVEIKENGITILSFNYDFSTPLNMSNITIMKQAAGIPGGGLITNGIIQTGTKTIYVDKIANTSKLCIKDINLVNISEISNMCNQQYEQLIDCPGTSGQYTCSVIGNKYKITGLIHSGVKEILPELKIMESDTKLIPGNTYSLKFIIDNSAPASSNNIYWKASVQGIGNFTNNYPLTLTSGQQIYVYVQLVGLGNMTPSGNYPINITIDPTTKVPEYNRTNNKQTIIAIIP